MRDIPSLRLQRIKANRARIHLIPAVYRSRRMPTAAVFPHLKAFKAIPEVRGIHDHRPIPEVQPAGHSQVVRRLKRYL